MAESESRERVWELIERIGICMLTTSSEEGLRARPLEPRPDRAAGVIWIVTDRRSGKLPEVARSHDVGLVFVDEKANAYLSITARAELWVDQTKLAGIWRRTDDVWWKGPDDPNVCLLCVHPVAAELWDGPSSKIATLIEFAKAQFTGERPNLGENRKVTVAMQPDLQKP